MSKGVHKIPNYKSRLSTVEGHCKDLLAKIKRRNKGTCDITLDFLVSLWGKQQGCCAITGHPMDINKGQGRRFSSPSLDRINPDLGYIQSNVRFVCDGINMMKGRLSDDELEAWCSRVISGLRGRRTYYIPNFSTLADLVDRMIVDIHKLAYWENLKRNEHAKSNPDSNLIAKADHLSRECCEIRSALKTEFNRMISEIINNQAYYPMKEVRTFYPAAETISEILSQACYYSAMETFKPEFEKYMKSLLTEEKTNNE